MYILSLVLAVLTALFVIPLIFPDAWFADGEKALWWLRVVGVPTLIVLYYVFLRLLGVLSVEQTDGGGPRSRNQNM